MTGGGCRVGIDETGAAACCAHTHPALANHASNNATGRKSLNLPFDRGSSQGLGFHGRLPSEEQQACCQRRINGDGAHKSIVLAMMQIKLP